MFKELSLGMDSSDPPQRQNDPSAYASQEELLQPPQHPPTSDLDRYRSTQLSIQAPTSAPATGKSENLPDYGYGYAERSSLGESAVKTTSISYQSENGQESQRQPQQYSQHGSTLMFNVANQQQHALSQSPYEDVQHYPQSRQSAAIEVFSNQFGGAQHYHGVGDSGPTSAPISGMGRQSAQTQYSQMSYIQQSSTTRESLSSGYSMAGTTQSLQIDSGLAEFSSSQQEIAYSGSQTALMKIYESVRDGKLPEASVILVNISNWLLTNAETLGTWLMKFFDGDEN